MKNFWHENGKLIGKLILNQFGATFLGIMILMAAFAATSQKDWLTLFASIFATVFYLFLIYNVVWERGAQDRIRVDAGRKEKKLLTGLWVSLVANIPNFIFGMLVVVSEPFRATTAWGQPTNTIGRALCLLWHSMYAGIAAHYSPNNPIIHVLDILPAVAVATGAYLLGHANCRLLQPFDSRKTKK